MPSSHPLAEVQLDASLKDLIYWLYDHGYYTTDCCSGIQADHPLKKDSVQCYISFDMTQMALPQVYRLVWAILTVKSRFHFEHLLIFPNNKDTIKLSFTIDEIHDPREPECEFAGVGNNERIITDADIHADTLEFSRRIQEFHTTKIPSAEINNPKWSQLSPIVRPIARYYYAYLILLAKPEYAQKHPHFSQYLTTLYTKVFRRWFEQFAQQFPARITEYRSEPAQDANISVILASWPQFHEIEGNTLKSVLMAALNLRTASQSPFLWDFARFWLINVDNLLAKYPIFNAILHTIMFEANPPLDALFI